MYLRSSFASLILFSAAATALAQSPAPPTCADLHLVPAVRECMAVQVLPVGELGVGIWGPKDADSQLIAQDL
jgi:hypothetical protein